MINFNMITEVHISYLKGNWLNQNVSIDSTGKRLNFTNQLRLSIDNLEFKNLLKKERCL